MLNDNLFKYRDDEIRLSTRELQLKISIALYEYLRNLELCNTIIQINREIFYSPLKSSRTFTYFYFLLQLLRFTLCPRHTWQSQLLLFCVRTPPNPMQCLWKSRQSFHRFHTIALSILNSWVWIKMNIVES